MREKAPGQIVSGLRSSKIALATAATSASNKDVASFAPGNCTPVNEVVSSVPPVFVAMRYSSTAAAREALNLGERGVDLGVEVGRHRTGRRRASRARQGSVEIAQSRRIAA